MSDKSRKKRLPKILTAAEAQRVLDTIDDGTDVGLRNRLMLEFMYRAGLRVSEVVSITTRQIHRDGAIDLFDAKGGDGTAYFDEGRILPLLDRWLEIRKGWAGGPKGPVPNLFIKPDGFRVSGRYLQRLLVKTKADLGIQGQLTPHVFRHTFATELIEEGAPLHEVQAAMRHANLATTAVYLHVRNPALRRRISERGKGV